MTGKWSNYCWKSGYEIPESTVWISTRGCFFEWEFKLSKCTKKLRMIWGLWCALALNMKSVRHGKTATTKSRPPQNREDLTCTRPDQETKHRGSQEQKNKHFLSPPLVKGSSKILPKEALEGGTWTTPVSASDQLSHRNSIYLPAHGGSRANMRLGQMLDWGNQLA